MRNAKNEIKADAFAPPNDSAAARAKAGNMPPGEESSIYWEDDGGALLLLRKDTNAAHGVVRVPVGVVERTLAAVPDLHGQVTFERQALRDNRYHGNIVFHAGLEKPQIKRICGYIALEARFVPVEDVK